LDVRHAGGEERHRRAKCGKSSAARAGVVRAAVGSKQRAARVARPRARRAGQRHVRAVHEHGEGLVETRRVFVFFSVEEAREEDAGVELVGFRAVKGEEFVGVVEPLEDDGGGGSGMRGGDLDAGEDVAHDRVQRGVVRGGVGEGLLERGARGVVPAHGARGDPGVHRGAVGPHGGELRDGGEGLLTHEELQNHQQEDDVHGSEHVPGGGLREMDARGGVSEGSVEGDESRGCDGAREIEGRRDQP